MTFSDDLSDNEYWRAYNEVNILFSQEIMQVWKRSKDLIWINDIHLLLVPYYLRGHDEHAHIGLFLHSAFPNSQIMSILPQRADLLKSMLSSDLIGFHLFEYAKNFVTSCRKVLDLNYEFRRGGCLGIDIDSKRYVSLKICHVGIEKESINEVITSQEFTKCFAKYFSHDSDFYGKQLIASVDYFHPISGLTNKLRAFHDFLKVNRDLAGQIMFI